VTKHVIIEGPDGAGKSTLVSDVLSQLGFRQAPRASSSLGGPVANLAAWTVDDINAMTGRWESHVYDRHPVISEPVYGPVVRGLARPGFDSVPWLQTRRLAMYGRTRVVWCMPPMVEVVRNVRASMDNQMDGVVAGIEQIYHAYEIAAKRWGGMAIRYDYTQDTLGDVLDWIKRECE
jgi:hypothetical protein